MRPNFIERGMSTSPSELRAALAQHVTVNDDALVVDLVDGALSVCPCPGIPLGAWHTD